MHMSVPGIRLLVFFVVFAGVVNDLRRARYARTGQECRRTTVSVDRGHGGSLRRRDVGGNRVGANRCAVVRLKKSCFFLISEKR